MKGLVMQIVAMAAFPAVGWILIKWASATRPEEGSACFYLVLFLKDGF